MSQWNCAVDGEKCGPMNEDLLRLWIAQRRVKNTDMLRKEGTVEWLQADSVPELRDAFATAPAGAPGDAPIDALAGLTEYARTSRKTHIRPHRGGTVLVLGILGLVVCCICGIIAWSMSKTDQREMSAGRMDPSGRGLTQAGELCGIVGIVLNTVGIIFWFVIVM